MGTLICPLCCNEEFSNQLSLKYHLLSITDNMYCPECSKRFDSILQLANHLDGTCGITGNTCKREEELTEEENTQEEENLIEHELSESLQQNEVIHQIDNQEKSEDLFNNQEKIAIFPFEKQMASCEEYLVSNLGRTARKRALVPSEWAKNKDKHRSDAQVEQDSFL
ncbi:hypothetical protein L9F63_004834, partial [Diploptera punctata]